MVQLPKGSKRKSKEYLVALSTKIKSATPSNGDGDTKSFSAVENVNVLDMFRNV